MTPVIRYRLLKQLLNRHAGCCGGVGDCLGRVTKPALAHSTRNPGQCSLHHGRQCRGDRAGVGPEQAGSPRQYGHSGAY